MRHEIEKLKIENISIKLLHTGVGNISESDVKLAAVPTGRQASGNETIIIGFNVVVSLTTRELAQRFGVLIKTFDIIYKLTEWFDEELTRRKPKVTTEEIVGTAKILRVFSKTKNKQVVGGKVTKGALVTDGKIKILRRNFPIGEGEILELQQQKIKTKKVTEGIEFGAMIEAKHEIAKGDIIESFVIKEQ